MSEMKIRHKVIGLFDNDGAGKNYYSQLIKFELPINIKVSKYPDIIIAANYPTYNTAGEIELKNLNGIATALEFYLGEENLKNEGRFIPITIKNNHGKFQNKGIKDKIQKDFKAKLQSVSDKSPEDIRGHFPELNNIFLHIFELA
jgi:hypothetical protein